jgi:hypothetical protein
MLDNLPQPMSPRLPMKSRKNFTTLFGSWAPTRKLRKARPRQRRKAKTGRFFNTEDRALTLRPHPA